MDLDGETMISLGRDDRSHRIVGDAFIQAGARVRRKIEVQMADSACMLVAEGQGIALVPSSSTIGWDGRGIVFLPVTERLTMTIWLYASGWEGMSNLSHHLLDATYQGILECERAFYPETGV